MGGSSEESQRTTIRMFSNQSLPMFTAIWRATGPLFIVGHQVANV
jgi:hypothetical protein